MNNFVLRGTYSALRILGVLAFCALGCRQHSEGNRLASVSMADIDRLGPDATEDDVIRLLGGRPLSGLPMFQYAAKGGGVFVFAFFPTNELTADPPVLPQDLKLVAVMKAASHEAFMRGEAFYVYPKAMSGRRFSGFLLPTTRESGDAR